VEDAPLQHSKGENKKATNNKVRSVGLFAVLFKNLSSKTSSERLVQSKNGKKNTLFRFIRLEQIERLPSSSASSTSLIMCFGIAFESLNSVPRVFIEQFVFFPSVRTN
jgi:hypothetical protein